MIALFCLVLMAEAFEGALDVFTPDPNGYRYFSISSAEILNPNAIVLSSDVYCWPKPSFYQNNEWNDLFLENRSVTYLGFAYAPLERWSIAFSLPFLNTQSTDGTSVQKGNGDLLLQSKYGVLSKEFSFLKLAIASDVTLPSGDVDLLMGNAQISFYPSIILELYSKSDRISWSTEAGYFIPRNQDIQERGYRIGTAVKFQWNDSIDVLSEYQRYLSKQEMLYSNVALGVQYSWRFIGIQTTLVSPMDPELKWTNIQYNIGFQMTPSWEYKSRDEDRDGILNKSDQCPNQQEDLDGFQDEDGCPEPDNDEDGIPDLQDECRLEKEDIDNYQDEDGCPEIDNDQDNILDSTDRCPNKAETINGYRDFDGCPDHSVSNDFDGDRYQDNKDKCPFLAEDFDDYQDEDGCPEIDNDNDGILDEKDNAPLEAESLKESLKKRIDE